MMKRYAFETGVYRPPSEGGSDSLLVRFTRNCPWNRCGFCAMYKQERFEVRSVEDICRDIDAMAAVANDLRDSSRKLGHGGHICHDGAMALMGQVPELNHHPGFAMLYHWLLSGGRTAFLQDANSLIMKTGDLIEALTCLRTTFASIERVTSYARARTVERKPASELAAICAAGLDRLHLGLETGDDDLLRSIHKGVSADGQIKAGKKAMAAGFQISEYWMPGLGGRAMTDGHAENTARVLNEINPHYIRSRPFRPIRGTPLRKALDQGKFEMPSAKEQLLEIRRMVEALDVTSRVCFDHAGNFWKDRRGAHIFSMSYEGYQFPEEKMALLARIDEGLSVA
ncbi:MAG: radical SAM protein [Desulfobacterales bacterium]|nr:radical SAM protein [Desulfobacterales bacterium]